MTNNINPTPEVIVHNLSDDSTFPNNGKLPLIVFQKAFRFEGKGDPAFIERTFSGNLWGGGWRNGLYPVHHYHSTAHEVLGIYSGSVRVQFGGEEGPLLVANTGDVVVVPAGVAHKNIWSSHDFRVAGAYPEGTTWDMNYGKEGERPGADTNIANVPFPLTDPVFGKDGLLMQHWEKY